MLEQLYLSLMLLHWMIARFHLFLDFQSMDEEILLKTVDYYS
jgi:hypothetical protein